MKRMFTQEQILKLIEENADVKPYVIEGAQDVTNEQLAEIFEKKPLVIFNIQSLGMLYLYHDDSDNDEIDYIEFYLDDDPWSVMQYHFIREDGVFVDPLPAKVYGQNIVNANYIGSLNWSIEHATHIDSDILQTSFSDETITTAIQGELNKCLNSSVIEYIGQYFKFGEGYSNPTGYRITFGSAEPNVGGAFLCFVVNITDNTVSAYYEEP